MRLCDKATVWAATPIRGREDFEPVVVYGDLREMKANLQTDYSELDLKQYGQTIDELVKLRFDEMPRLANGDMIYLSKPDGSAATVGGAEFIDYGRGDFEVVGVSCGYWGRARNPVTIRAKAVVK